MATATPMQVAAEHRCDAHLDLLDLLNLLDTRALPCGHARSLVHMC